MGACARHVLKLQGVKGEATLPADCDAASLSLVCWALRTCTTKHMKCENLSEQQYSQRTGWYLSA